MIYRMRSNHFQIGRYLKDLRGVPLYVTVIQLNEPCSLNVRDTRSTYPIQ